MTFEEADRRYPYDPLARSPMLRGLEKLRAFEDPEWRRIVFDTYSRPGPLRDAHVDDPTGDRHP